MLIILIPRQFYHYFFILLFTSLIFEIKTSEKDLALANKSRKKGDTGKRYSTAQKKKIIAFANKAGRGGISAACAEFGVSYIALRRWMDFGPEGNGRKVGRPRKEASATGGAAKSNTSALAIIKEIKIQLTALAVSLK